MNKTELVAAMAERAEISKKDAEAALKAFTDVVAEELKKGEKIQLVGFGTFEVSERAARTGRNPQTGAEKSSEGHGKLIDIQMKSQGAQNKRFWAPFYVCPAARSVQTQESEVWR